MPWKAFKNSSGKWVVKKLDADGDPVGAPLGTHDTEAEAAAQVRALYANEPEAKAVKFASESEVDLVGLLAPYGGIFNGRDVVGEYFSKNTDFVLDWFPDSADGKSGGRPLLFHHGMDPKTGVSVVGRIKSVSQDDLGLWMQAQLDANHEYYTAIAGLIKQGKLGLSSGSMRHLVDVNRKTGEILRWPLIEGSLTPTPANPLADVDFAEAKSHYKAIGIDLPDDLDVLKAMGNEKKPMGMASMRKMVTDMADEMGVEMSSSEMQTIMSAMEGMDKEEAQAHAKREMRKMESKAAKSVSWEDIRSEVSALCQKRLNWGMPGEMASYCYVKETYADHCIVEVCRDGQERYYSVPFSLAEDGHVDGLGDATEVEESYVPKTPPDMPMGMMAEMAKSYIAALMERTKDLHERRTKDGRMISAPNRQKLMDCVSAMGEATGVLQTLLRASEPKAKADMGRLRREADYLGLFARTI